MRTVSFCSGALVLFFVILFFLLAHAQTLEQGCFDILWQMNLEASKALHENNIEKAKEGFLRAYELYKKCFPPEQIAEEDKEKIAELSFKIYAGLGAVYASLEDYKKAIEIYEEGQQLFPENAAQFQDVIDAAKEFQK